MGHFLNPGRCNFEAVRCSKYFVDKTGLLSITNAALGRDRRLFCVSRPRGFGKTTDAEMLTAYYCQGEDSSSLFDGLIISSAPDYKEHLNQHHVIHISMRTMDSLLHEAQSNQKMEHPKGTPNFLSMNLVDYTNYTLREELKAAFPGCSTWDKCLIRVLFDIHSSAEGHSKFIFIIDEWDHIYRAYPKDIALQDRYVSFLTSLFNSMLTGRCILLAYLTGIYPIQGYMRQSDLGHFDAFTMIYPFEMAEYTGFTEADVAGLCRNSSLSEAKVKAWYDGYHMNEALSVYCPASVICAVQNGTCKNDWSHTESYSDLSTYIDLDLSGLRQAVALLLCDDPVSCNVSRFSNDVGEPKSKDELLTMLVHLGYLTCRKVEDDVADLAIPNKEIRMQFENNMNSDRWGPIVQDITHSASLLKATWSGDENEVARSVDRVHYDLTSSLDYNAEESLRCVIMVAYQAAKQYYKIEKEQPAGHGRADLIFVPKILPDAEPATPMVIELKWNKTADSAFQQIKDKKYPRIFEDYPDVILVGIHYDADSREHACIIEHYDPQNR